MGGIVNLIKKLFSGIFSFLGGLLGGKKSSSGYYLELDDDKAVKPASKPAQVEPAKAEKVEPAKAEAVNGNAPEAESTKAVAVEAAPAKAEPAKTEAAATNGASLNGAAPATNPLNLPQPTVSFASEYLTPKPTNTRRRPGANMNPYLEMAKGMKTSNN